jgi:uncharacterized protein (DUF608 family)
MSNQEILNRFGKLPITEAFDNNTALVKNSLEDLRQTERFPSYLQEGAYFQIWNSSGMQVQSGSTQKGDNYIDMISFPAGLYFLLVASNTGKKLLCKFIIQS